MGDGCLPLFIQTKLAKEFRFVGGRIVGLAQKGEQAFAKSHRGFSGAARGPCFEIGLTKERPIVRGDENRPCRQ